MSKREIWFVVLLAGITAVIFGAGFMAGKYQSTHRLKELITKYNYGETLANLMRSVDPKKKIIPGEIARAYLDPAQAAKQMDNIIWAVPDVLSPFVLSAPEPGRHHNALINSWQLRDSREVRLPKPEGVYRIFVTGGSTAFGSGAPSQKTILSAYLESQLNQRQEEKTRRVYEVFTAANPAWSTTHERIFIANRISEWKPDLVVSFSGINDVHWAWRGENIFWFFTYFDHFVFDLINEAYRLSGEAPMVDVAKPQASPIPPELVATRLEKNVRLASQALELCHAQYVFALQPNFAATQKPLSPREKKIGLTLDGDMDKYFARCYAEMRQHLTQLHLPNFHFVDLTDVFDSLPASEEIFIDRYHFGDKGNQIIAQALAVRLGEQVLAEDLTPRKSLKLEKNTAVSGLQ
jgi:lysophospholipase L1-like esterase